MIIGKIKQALLNLRKKAQEHPEKLEVNEKDWFVPDDLGIVWEPVISYSVTGGAICIIVEDVDDEDSESKGEIAITEK